MFEKPAINGVTWAAVAAALALAGQAAAQSSAPDKDAAAHEVFLRLKAPLDEPRGLCVDIPGHRERVNVNRPLVVHTCKWEIWNLDERFDAEAVDRGELRMPAYGQCVGVATAAAGANVVLGPCDGASVRRWNVANGQIRLAAGPDLCLTVGTEPSQLTPGGRRLPSRHVARSLTLEPCRDSARDRQVWRRVPPRS